MTHTSQPNAPSMDEFAQAVLEIGKCGITAEDAKRGAAQAALTIAGFYGDAEVGQ